MPRRSRAVRPHAAEVGLAFDGQLCRGGAYDAALLACDSIAILPEGMSVSGLSGWREWQARSLPTPGTESNVKEIFDKCPRARA